MRRLVEAGGMFHLTMAEKSLLIGDEIADLLVAYAAAVAGAGAGDHVSLHAIGVDGEQVTVQVLLNTGTTMLVESSSSTLPEPGNDELALHLRDRLAFYGLLPGGEPPTAMGSGT